MKCIARVVLPTVAILSGCGGGSPNAAIAIPNSQQFAYNGAAPFHRIQAPNAVKDGIYISAFAQKLVLGFRSHYHRDHGRGPFCTIYPGSGPGPNKADSPDITADGEGNLIVPRGSDDSVYVYRGPDMCGPNVGKFKDPYGWPGDAATFNAVTGTIVIANYLDSHHILPGNVAICTFKSGCTKELKLSILGYGGGVALAKNGDCWVSVENAAYTGAVMNYWPGCKGPRKAVTGFMNSSFGSLSIDKDGDLVSVDTYGGGSGQLWVYSGCNPACTVVGGPFALQHNPLFGALNAKGDTFGVMETEFPYTNVDIYKYSLTKLTYEYSFASHYAPVAGPSGFAYSPALEP